MKEERQGEQFGWSSRLLVHRQRYQLGSEEGGEGAWGLNQPS